MRCPHQLCKENEWQLDKLTTASTSCQPLNQDSWYHWYV